MSVNVRLCVLVIAGASACLGDFESRPAYEEEVFSCGGENAEAWSEAVDACRRAFTEDPSRCAGVMSLDGRLAGDPVRVTSELDSSLFRILSAEDGPTLARVDMAGVTPYFAATLVLDELGGPADESSGPARDVTVIDELDLPMRNDDVRATLNLRASDGVSSRTFAAKSGTLRLTSQSRHELVGSFDVHMDDDDEAHESGDDELRGCFHVFAQKTRFEEP